MTRKLAPVRPCDAGCGWFVRIRGRIKLCDECCSKCECGNRKSRDRPRCRDCAGQAAEIAKQLGARGDKPIVWVKNRRGIFVNVAR